MNMLNTNIQITSDHFESMGQLFLHVVITRGEEELYRRVIDANEPEHFIQMTTEAAAALGGGLGEIEQALTEPVFRAREWWARKKVADQSGEGFRASFLTSAELEGMDARHRWLIKHVLVRDQPVLLGGPKKSLKTSIMLDAALSLGSGKPFLGKFEVPERVKVAVLSGESGQITVRETALRVAQFKGVKLAACEVLWGFDLPRLGVDEDLAALSAGLRDGGVGVVFIDPAYLCLLAGTPDLQANNMFQVGPLLLRVAKVCRDSGTTLVLVHHTTNPAGMLRMQAGEPLELEDLAYAGFQEFARQWVLVNRRQKYEPGTGKHCLWMNLGGSAGHSGCWGVDVEEGQLSDDFGGRRWLVQVRSMEDALKGINEARERKKEVGKRARLGEDTEKVLKALEAVPEGETQAAICKMTGLQARVVGPVLTGLLGQRKVVRTQVRKSSGKGETWYDAWRVASSGEFLAAKIEEMGLVPAEEGEGVPKGPRRRPAGSIVAQREREDTDFLDEVGAAGGGQ
jgi:replicative DNA helicase